MIYTTHSPVTPTHVFKIQFHISSLHIIIASICLFNSLYELARSTFFAYALYYCPVSITITTGGSRVKESTQVCKDNDNNIK